MTSQYIEEEEFTSQFNSKTVKRIISLTFPHWRWLVGFVLSIGFVSFIDAYFTFLSKRIIDDAIIAGDISELIEIVTIYGVLIIFQAIGVFGFIYLTGILGQRVNYDLRKKLFDKLQDLSLSYFSRTPVGWIMSRVTSDTERVSDLVTWGLLDISWGVFNIASSAFFMFIIDWRLALIVLTMVPILIWVAIEFRKRILVEYRDVRKNNSKITGAYNENITGVKVVKALGREEENLFEFNKLTSVMYGSSYRAAWLSALFLPTVQIISSFAIGITVWYGGLQTHYGTLTIGGIQAFVSYIVFMMWPIQDLARVYAELQNSIASGERIFSLMDSSPDVTDTRDAFDPGTIQGDIEFNNVNFYYEEGEPILTDFNLKVTRGETIALVGPTGGGKSTIVNLLCRFYEPQNGEIRIGDTNYTHLTLHAIQSRIGIVLQTPHLFSGTVKDNIKYGDLHASESQIIEASRLAGAHEFISGLTNGYEEEVGEGGNLLSTGQKQLISLARAILTKPEVFIMDEATSSVDTLTETLIQKGIENLMKGRTSFIIAHRLSTIKRADRILVIEDGKILEMGTHAQLLRAHGSYFRLYTQQFRQQLSRDYNLNNITGAVAA